ncbi:MFS transporter [Oceaniradius stylonematis]|uniref:MFS transporter n=1 Tax=Oceaniradius stylonematis TaxID=2184161 RepID=UPI00273F9D8C|nr:MFS transporter [Oceaniradius stylonematis]
MRRLFSSPLFLVLALWLAGLGCAAQFAKMAVILPALQDHYGETGVASGFLVSLIALMGIVLGLVAGVLAIRIGLRRLLLTGIVLGAVVSFIQATMPPFSWMLAIRFVEGLSHLAIVVATPTLIAQITPARHQGAALTLWGTFFGVAFAAAALIAPALVSAGGPGAVFLAHGVYMAVFAVLLALVLPRPAPLAVAAPPLGPRQLIARHIDIYTSPTIGAPAIGWVFYTLTFVALLAVLPPFIDAEQRVLATALMPLASIVSSMTLGVFLLRYVPATTVVQIGFVAAAVFGALFAVAGPAAWLAVALFACLGLVQGASFAAVPQLNAGTADRALANGGLAQTGNLGNTTGTPLLIAIIAVTGFTGVPWFLLGCYLIAIGANAALARRRRQAGSGAVS